MRDKRILAIRVALRRRVIQTIENTKGGLGALFSNLAGGQVRESPFKESLKAELARYAKSLFADDGAGGAEVRCGDLEQPVRDNYRRPNCAPTQ